MHSKLRLAIVTGAGGGLGRAFCMQLAGASNWHIVAIDVDEPAGRKTVALMAERQATASAGGGEFVRLDVTDRDAWRQLADRLATDVERGIVPSPALLVNNAGVCAAGEVLGAGEPLDNRDPWRRLMEVNFFGALNGCHAIGPLLRQAARVPCPRPRGHVEPPESMATSADLRGHATHPAVINVASIFGLLPAPSLGAYSASKAAVVALSEALYAELRPVGVGVTIVAPGFFQSGLLERGEFPNDLHRAEAERRSRVAKFGAADVARAALAASAHGQLYCVMGRRARWLWRLKRLAPGALHRFVARRYHRTFPEP